MCGVSTYKYKESNFDSYKDLIELEFNRLLYLQNMQLKRMINCISENIIDKNNAFNIMQEILMTNKALTIKYKKIYETKHI